MTSTARKLFIFDFICGLSGALIYFLLFDFMLETLALPRWLALTQLLCNFLYGVFGAVLFVKRIEQLVFYRFLMNMNFVYASFCFVVAATLSWQSSHKGALLLLVEGLFIAFLARLEQRSLSSI